MPNYLVTHEFTDEAADIVGPCTVLVRNANTPDRVREVFFAEFVPQCRITGIEPVDFDTPGCADFSLDAHDYD
jgi:hypothetical protein